MLECNKEVERWAAYCARGAQGPAPNCTMKNEATVSLEACDGVQEMCVTVRVSLPSFVNCKLAKLVCQLLGSTAPNPIAGGAMSSSPSS